MLASSAPSLGLPPPGSIAPPDKAKDRSELSQAILANSKNAPIKIVGSQNNIIGIVLPLRRFNTSNLDTR
jgi:hypothetical protein